MSSACLLEIELRGLRDTSIRVRLSASEKAEIEALAARARLSLSELVRRSIRLWEASK